MASPTRFEVRCERCQASFAPETKRCVHCRGPLGKRLLSFPGGDGVTQRSAPDSNAPKLPSADAPPNLGRFIRYALIALGVAAALARRFLDNP